MQFKFLGMPHAFNLPCDFAAGFYFIVCKLQVVEVTEVKMGIAYRAVKTHTQHKQGLRAWPCREHLLTYLLLFWLCLVGENYGLIRLKRFITLFTVELYN